MIVLIFFHNIIEFLPHPQITLMYFFTVLKQIPSYSNSLYSLFPYDNAD